MGSASSHKVRDKNKDNNIVVDVEDSEPKSSPASVSKLSYPHGFNDDNPKFLHRQGSQKN